MTNRLLNKPHDACIDFAYDEIDVNIDIVQRIEFSNVQCTLTLKNKGQISVKPDIVILVFNKDGVLLWNATETWIFNELQPGCKFFKTFPFDLLMPFALKYSNYANNFDLIPRWILVY